jgi:hypothetical protein
MKKDAVVRANVIGASGRYRDEARDMPFKLTRSDRWWVFIHEKCDMFLAI